jgi:hypothetical protein
MIRQMAFVMLMMVALVMAGCASPSVSKEGPGGPDPATFQGVRLYQTMISTGQYAVDVSAEGDVNVQVQRGPGAIQRAALHLTPAQIDTLKQALKGWKKLASEYAGDWQNLYQITYDGYKVSVHDIQDQAPAQFAAVKKLLDEYGRQALTAATQTAPAGGAASRP